jgi:ribonuclease HII
LLKLLKRKQLNQKRIINLRKNINIFYQERKRIEKLKYFEKKCLTKGFNYIAGIDEVGRGALAGPVVAAAVVIKDIDYFHINYLKDSKKLNKGKRERLSELIRSKADNIGIGIVGPDIIDKINIAQATFLAMKRAIIDLKRFPDYILVDGFKIPFINIPQDYIIKGDNKSVSIAAASIIAKVYRDNIMLDFHKKYPEYQFDKNVGYGTEKHIIAIKQFGITSIHRKTFKGVFDDVNNTENEKQGILYQYKIKINE